MLNGLSKRRSSIVSLVPSRSSHKSHITQLMDSNGKHFDCSPVDDSECSEMFFYKRKSSVQIDPDTKRILFHQKDQSNDHLEEVLEQIDVSLDASTIEQLQSMSTCEKKYWIQKLIESEPNATNAHHHELVVRSSSNPTTCLQPLTESRSESSNNIDFDSIDHRHNKMIKKSSLKTNGGCSIS